MTTFKSGLIIPPQTIAEATYPVVGSPALYRPPVQLDRRTELLSASNQGPTSMCASEAMAGWLEHYRWKFYAIAEQIDPEPIHKKAKEIDGYPNDEGTTLQAAVMAAHYIGLLPTPSSLLEVRSLDSLKQAIHRYGVVICAFNITQGWSQAGADGFIGNDDTVMGAHAVLACGYSEIDEPQFVGVQNSWGEADGWRGFVRLTAEQFDRQFIYGITWKG
jgi:hypothetical protein